MNALLLSHDKLPWRKIMRLAWPTSLSMALHTSYSLIDMYWVASLGKDAVAAVTLCGILFWAIFALSQTFGTGVHALIARTCGAGNHHRAGRILRDTIVASIVCGLLAAIVVIYFDRPILQLLGAEPEVVATGASYLRLMALGFPAIIAQFTLISAFRATGDMVTPLWLTGLSCAVNAILDPLLIFGAFGIAGFGIAGAAMASVLAFFVTFIVGFCLLRYRRDYLRLPRHGKPDFLALKDMIRVGLPSGLHYLLLSLTQTVMIRLVAAYGTNALATSGIGARVAQLSFIPCIGVGAATATLVGQYMGARREHEAEQIVRHAVKITFVITAIIGGIYALFPRYLIGLFRDDPQILDLGSVYLRIDAAAFLFTAITIILTRVFQGAGDTGWPTLAAAIRFVLFLAMALLTSRFTQLDAIGIWLAMGLSSVVHAGLVLYLYRRGSWKYKRLHSVESVVAAIASSKG